MMVRGAALSVAPLPGLERLYDEGPEFAPLTPGYIPTHPTGAERRQLPSVLLEVTRPRCYCAF
jgi:hypothetical protein